MGATKLGGNVITFASRNIHPEEGEWFRPSRRSPARDHQGGDGALSQEAWKLVGRLSSEGTGEEEWIAFCVLDGG